MSTTTGGDEVKHSPKKVQKISLLKIFFNFIFFLFDLFVFCLFYMKTMKADFNMSFAGRKLKN